MPEIVRRIGRLGILVQRLQQDVGVEHVNPHGSADHVRVETAARRIAVLRLLLETHNAVLGVDFRDAEAAGFGGRHLDGGDGDLRVMLPVPLHHVPVVHFVDLVGRQQSA